MTTKTKKQKKKKLTAAQKKFRQEIIKSGRAKVKAQRDADFKSTTLEQRKEFIGLMHGGKTMKQARDVVGMSLDAAIEVWRRNIKKTVFHSLKPVEEVK